jgi:hypothetical protein
MCHVMRDRLEERVAERDGLPAGDSIAVLVEP